MRRFFVALLFASLALPSIDAAPPRSQPAPPTPAPAAAESTRKPFAGWWFSNPKARPTPTPAPAPTPVATRRPRKPASRGETDTPEESTAKPTPKAPAPKLAKKAVPATKDDLSELDDVAKFKVVKTKAMEDPELKELKAKADSAIDEDEGRKATESYNRALFRKVRALEPSLDGYVDKVEESMQKRLTAEKRSQ
jgi:hypothetical protein